MKTAIKVSKNKDYVTIQIPNDLIVHLTDTSGDGVTVSNRRYYLNEFTEVLKMDLGTGQSDVECMVVGAIDCLIESGSDNLDFGGMHGTDK